MSRKVTLLKQNKYRVSKFPNESIEEYIIRRDSINTTEEFTSSDLTVEDLKKQIDEVEESFFKIQSILQKCSKVSRRKIKQRFCNDD